MSESTEPTGQRFEVLVPIGDHIADPQQLAVDEWHRMLARQGGTPIGEPTVEAQPQGQSDYLTTWHVVGQATR